ELAAREHGGRQRARALEHEDQHGASRRLLQRLEEGLRRLARHAIGVVQDEYLVPTERRLERGPALELTDRSDTDRPRALRIALGWRGNDQVDVGMLIFIGFARPD